MLLICTHSAAETIINTRTSQSQTTGQIAADSNNNFIVTWSSYEQDGDSGGIYAKKFDENFNVLCPEFKVNTTTEGNQKAPDIAMDSRGNFIIVWQGPGDDQEEIFAQRFDSQCNMTGEEFQVNTATFSRQQYPKIAINQNGLFVIVWENEVFGGYPKEARTIEARIFNSDGIAVTDQFTVNLLFDCRYPDVAMGCGDHFIVTWMQTHSSSSPNIIMARKLNIDASEVTPPFQVNSSDFFSVTKPSIAANGLDYFVITWAGHFEAASLDDIYARKYNDNCIAETSEFMVNSITEGLQENPNVAINGSHEFVITWNSEQAYNENMKEVYGQRYDQFNKPIGDQIHINTYVVDDQKYPAVLLYENGNFITIWQSFGQNTSDYDVIADKFPKAAFADFNGDYFTNSIDFSYLCGEWMKSGNPLITDLIDDNKIDEQDFLAFTRQWLKPCYDCNQIDINKDSKIDSKDYAFWAKNLTQKGPNIKGDITCDGIVDFNDLGPLLSNYPCICE
jgi:hypothetical protein